MVRGKRYAKRYSGEGDFSRNVREMIEMIKNETVSSKKIDYKKMKVSRHARARVLEYCKCNSNGVEKRIKWLLQRSKRIGEQLSFDGRINILFVYKQYAIYMSPNLECVVTVHKFQNISYNPIRIILPQLQEKFKGEELRQELVRLHKDAWHDIEVREHEQLKRVLEIDNEVNNQFKRLKELRTGYSPKHYTKYIKTRIQEERTKLVTEGKKLFDLKLEKRHIGKSITAVM